MKFTDYLKSRSYARRSIATIKRTLRIHDKWLQEERLQAEQVTYRELLSFMKYCQQQGVSQRTVQHYLGAIRHYYEYLKREGRIESNPVAGVKVQGVRRKVLYHIFQPPELHAIYNSYQGERLSQRRNKVMLGLVVYQGIATDELGRLEVGHVKLREGKIEVPGSVSREGRTLNLESHQVMDMYDYILEVRPAILKKSKQETERLMISPEGGLVVSNFMTRLMVMVRKQNPLVVNAKQLRASVICKWLRMYNLRQVQYLAGHRYISSTEYYLQNEMEGLQEEVNQFHPLG